MKSKIILACALVAFFASVPAHSETQGGERRDDRRDNRQEARDVKDECKENDSRAECRQLKRETKQDGRHDDDTNQPAGEATETK